MSSFWDIISTDKAHLDIADCSDRAILRLLAPSGRGGRSRDLLAAERSLGRSPQSHRPGLDAARPAGKGCGHRIGPAGLTRGCFRRRRLRKHLGQKGLALRVRYSKTEISLSGPATAVPSRRLLERLPLIYGVDPVNFTGGSPSQLLT
jgi:hypothetical protein